MAEIDAARAVANLKELRSLTGDELGAQRVAWTDTWVKARDWFREITMEGVGTHRYPGYLVRMLRTPEEVRLPPCRLGEHNEEIYLDLLGYSREEYDALVAKELVGTRYTEAILANA